MSRSKAGIYQPHVEQLIKTGHAYYAFDTSEALTAMRERLKEAGSS
ncbi:MAG: glutamate--tRNA ligase family protein, partial [Bacteroidota bacterium]